MKTIILIITLIAQATFASNAFCIDSIKLPFSNNQLYLKKYLEITIPTPTKYQQQELEYHLVIYNYLENKRLHKISPTADFRVKLALNNKTIHVYAFIKDKNTRKALAVSQGVKLRLPWSKYHIYRSLFKQSLYATMQLNSTASMDTKIKEIENVLETANYLRIYTEQGVLSTAQQYAIGYAKNQAINFSRDNFGEGSAVIFDAIFESADIYLSCAQGAKSCASSTIDKTIVAINRVTTLFDILFKDHRYYTALTLHEALNTYYSYVDAAGGIDSNEKLRFCTDQAYEKILGAARDYCILSGIFVTKQTIYDEAYALTVIINDIYLKSLPKT